jgi:transposase
LLSPLIEVKNQLKNTMRTIGIDVSKATLDVALRNEQGVVKEERVKNSAGALKGLLRKWKKQGFCEQGTLVCLEPTGHYSLGVIKVLLDLGHRTWLAHATDIHLSLGMQRGKNDKTDARRIAEYAFRFQDKARELNVSYLDFAQLKSLLALRERLVKERAKNRAQLKDNVQYTSAEVRGLVKAEVERQLRALERSISKLEKAIEKMLQKDEQLARKNRLAQTVSGVGPVLASELMAHTEGFTRFDSPRQLVCYVGAAPFEESSGSSVRGKTSTSSFANKRLKSLVRLAALAAVRVPGDLRDYYQRKIQEGKKPTVVLNNVAGKIIHHLWAVIHKSRSYTPYLHMS